MFQEITYYQILGKPFIMYLGLATLLCFGTTAMIAVLTMKGIKKWPISWHTTAAAISFVLATIHAVLGVLLYF